MKAVTIVSGGQTGVDRAALDAALDAALAVAPPVGGGVPPGDSPKMVLFRHVIR